MPADTSWGVWTWQWCCGGQDVLSVRTHVAELRPKHAAYFRLLLPSLGLVPTYEMWHYRKQRERDSQPNVQQWAHIQNMQKKKKKRNTKRRIQITPWKKGREKK